MRTSGPWRTRAPEGPPPYGCWPGLRLLTKSSSVCLGMPGSKQRRQRASYMSAAPTTIRSSAPRRRCVCLPGLPQRTQMASVLVMRFGQRQQIRDGDERAAQVIGVQPGDDHLLAAIGQALRHVHQALAHEIRLVHADHFRAPVHAVQDLAAGVHDFGLHAQIAVRHDLVDGVARVDDGLEHLHSFARDHGAAQAPDQLFALAGEHGAADHFDPSDVAADEFHEIALACHSADWRCAIWAMGPPMYNAGL